MRLATRVLLPVIGVALGGVTGCASQAPARSAAPAEPSPPVVTRGAPAPVADHPTDVPPASASQPRTTQPVPADTNAHTRSVAEALTTRTHPERLSAMVAPPPFSLAQYRKDPQAYLNEVVPGRAWQSAQPAPGVPELQLVGSPPAPLNPGQSVTLAVRTVPNGVVSWTSMDLGSFQNQLTAISVPADDTGLASVTFTATPGVTGRVNVLAGSPLASGQVSYRILVNGAPFIAAPAASAPSTGTQP